MSADKTKSTKNQITRRDFLGVVWTALSVILGAETAGAVFKFIQPINTGGFGGVVNAGKVDDFQRGSITHNQAGRFYLVRMEDGGFLALWQKCTHLGCSVPWVEAENQFHCPCHGSLYDLVGEVTGGPAPRPLDLFPVTIQDGQVFVDTGHPITRSEYDASQTTKA
ncbi:MAG: ubiquinol-cytochrome c reductase iron-sulfur subunit [Chloroflexota bacterium]